MVSRAASSQNSKNPVLSTTTSSDSPTPTQLPEAEGKFDLATFRESEDGQKLVGWIKNEFERARQARQTKQLQWYQNMSMFYGNQWAERLRNVNMAGISDKLTTPKKPYYQSRRTVNRTRSFVRTEHSKFLSSIPSAVSVPSTADDEDVRAALAAEQAWLSISQGRKLRRHYTRAMWWTIVTGNGFIKTSWDNTIVPDKTNPESKGDISFGSITPFNLFVPDLREQEIEDQPFIILAYQKPVEWCRYAYAKELEGTNLSGSGTGNHTILEEGYLNLSSGGNKLETVTLYEAWVKPGATPILPNGGVVILVGDTIIGVTPEGMPYDHGMYPITKFEHIPTSTFYADSPLVDTNALQKEYNELRTEISLAGKRMARPQILAQRGSIVPQKLTNEPGLVIEYKPGTPAPIPMQMAQLPQYYVDQQNVILADWEDVTGQHEVSRGQAPAGITAGTAINYLQEKDDQFLTPQYQSVEDGYEKLATSAVGLFVQYVDLPRKIKTVGSDGAFDTVLLQGSNIAAGLDIRIEQGSSIGQSMAAKEAKVMDMFSIGLLPGDMALKLLEIGGAQKILDTLSVAEKKAQRENVKMKLLKDEDIQLHVDEFEMQSMTGMGDPTMGRPSALVPQGDPFQPPPEQQAAPPVIPVDDFDVHSVHIDTHNRFRMSQEYETLSPAVKAQFADHVALHEEALMQDQLKNFLSQIPEGGEEGDPGAEDPLAAEGEPSAPGDTLAGNGAAPDLSAPVTGGQ